MSEENVLVCIPRRACRMRYGCVVSRCAALLRARWHVQVRASSGASRNPTSETELASSKARDVGFGMLTRVRIPLGQIKRSAARDREEADAMRLPDGGFGAST